MNAARAAALRDHAATIIVSALSAMFATTLILITDVMTVAAEPELLEDSATLRMMFLIVSFVFIGIALYVGAIITANTFATIIAGRTRTIALYRLIGSTSARIRLKVALEGLVTGTIGAVGGVVLGTILVALFTVVAPVFGWLPKERSYPLFDPLIFFAGITVVVTVWIAAWSGTRRVAGVSPIAATGAAVELAPEDSRNRPGRTKWAYTLLALGGVLIVLGVIVSVSYPGALLISFGGGLLSFTGIALGSHLIMPPILRWTGKLTARGPVGKIAAANALRFPERSARATIGLVIGVTLVTMFAIALASFKTMAELAFTEESDAGPVLDQTVTLATVILIGLVAISAVIAAVGMVNTLSLSVMQRTRELGLLRALGFTSDQVRKMVVIESAQMTIAALGFGLVLGTFYGWLAAQSLFGIELGFMPPTIPWPVIVGVIVFGVALSWVAAATPALKVAKLSPVAALAQE